MSGTWEVQQYILETVSSMKVKVDDAATVAKRMKCRLDKLETIDITAITSEVDALRARVDRMEEPCARVKDISADLESVSMKVGRMEEPCARVKDITADLDSFNMKVELDIQELGKLASIERSSSHSPHSASKGNDPAMMIDDLRERLDHLEKLFLFVDFDAVEASAKKLLRGVGTADAGRLGGARGGAAGGSVSLKRTPAVPSSRLSLDVSEDRVLADVSSCVPPQHLGRGASKSPSDGRKSLEGPHVDSAILAAQSAASAPGADPTGVDKVRKARWDSMVDYLVAEMRGAGRLDPIAVSAFQGELVASLMAAFDRPTTIPEMEAEMRSVALKWCRM